MTSSPTVEWVQAGLAISAQALRAVSAERTKPSIRPPAMSLRAEVLP